MRHKTIFLAALLSLFLIPLSSAQSLPQCSDTPSVGVNCTFVTPPIICSNFTFNITNMAGSIIENGTLEVHNAALNEYRFSFTHIDSPADFQIQLCEGTFREVFVGGDVKVPTVVVGQLFFFATIFIFSFLLFVTSIKLQEPVFGFFSATGFILTGALLMINPFDFLTGKATFLGLELFGLGLLVLGIYVMFTSIRGFFGTGRKEEGEGPSGGFEDGYEL